MISRRNIAASWVDVDSRLFDSVKANRVYNDYLDLLEFADELGDDRSGVNEHHQNAHGLIPRHN